MSDDQLSLFKRKTFPAISSASPIDLTPPTGASTVMSTLSAYHVYLKSTSESKYTPDDFYGDIKKFALFVREKKIQDIAVQDIQEWISVLQSPKGENLKPKTVSRKISALTHYFFWLIQQGAVTNNPMSSIGYKRVVAPLPDILFESECQLLLQIASSNPRAYLLFLLLLETGIKTEELFTLRIAHFDFSNKYAPEVWVKHTGRKARKDRKLKLPAEIVPVFAEYVKAYGITDLLFPYTDRLMRVIIANVVKQANIPKKVSAQILRDSYVVRCLKRGEDIDMVLTRLGLNETTWKDAQEKYLLLASRGI